MCVPIMFQAMSRSLYKARYGLVPAGRSEANMTGPAGATRALTRSPDIPAPRHASLAGFHAFTPGYYSGWDDAGTGHEESPLPTCAS
jgi:hypothetical protein